MTQKHTSEQEKCANVFLIVKMIYCIVQMHIYLNFILLSFPSKFCYCGQRKRRFAFNDSIKYY